MRKILIILLLIPLLGIAQQQKNNREAQSIPVEKTISQKQLDLFKKEIRDSLNSISHKVNMGDETLKAAKEFSEKSKSTLEWFEKYLMYILAFISFIIYLIWKKHITELHEALESYKEGILKDAKKSFKKTIKEFKTSYDQQIERLLTTEEASMKIKEDALLSFILPPSGSVNPEFNDLKNIIMQEFNQKEVEIKNVDLDTIKNNDAFKYFINQNAFPKVLILTDEIFKYSEKNIKRQLITEFEKILQNNNHHPDKTEIEKFVNNNRHDILKSIKGLMITDSNIETFINELIQKNIDEKENAKSLVEELESNNIGVAIFGYEKLPGYNKFKGYANNPYSFYSNLNNLLKYMYYYKKYN